MKPDYISVLFFTVVSSFFLWIVDINFQLILSLYTYAINFIISAIVIYSLLSFLYGYRSHKILKWASTIQQKTLKQKTKIYTFNSSTESELSDSKAVDFQNLVFS